MDTEARPLMGRAFGMSPAGPSRWVRVIRTGKGVAGRGVRG